jgi:hypothetical protein
LTSSQTHAITAQVVSAVLDDLDEVASKVWEVGEEAQHLLAAHVDPLHALKDKAGGVALSSELEEYRKLKQSGEGGGRDSRLRRVLQICDGQVAKAVARAWDAWKKHVASLAPKMLGRIDHETAKLRNEICNLSAKVQEVVDKDEAAASLLAERALNRELNAMNSELRQNIQELGTKLHEVGQCPISRRQDMIKDLFLDREERLAQYRREAKSLEEQFKRLEEAVGAGVIDEILGPDDGRPEGAQGTQGGQGMQGMQGVGMGGFRGAEEEKARASADGAGALRASFGRNSSSSPPRQSQQRGRGRRHNPHPHPNHIELPSWYEPGSRRNAQKIIVFEVRRLRVALTELQRQKQRLEDKAICESSRAAQLTVAVQSLQKRLTDRERGQVALRSLLLQRLGEAGVNELVVALEQVGAGSEVLLRETSQRMAHSTASVPAVQQR